jgi:hypothetical protein
LPGEYTSLVVRAVAVAVAVMIATAVMKNHNWSTPHHSALCTAQPSNQLTTSVHLQIPSQISILLDPAVLGALAFAVLGPTVFSFTALSYSSKKLKPSVNSAYITLQPVLVALLSLLLFGDMLSSAEIQSGCVVLAGLYLTVIGNPEVDRAWREYVSDLGTNVPQTLENVAETAVAVSENVVDTVAETVTAVSENVVETVSETVTEVQESVTDLHLSLREKIENVVSDSADSLDDQSNSLVRRLEELVSTKDKK